MEKKQKDNMIKDLPLASKPLIFRLKRGGSFFQVLIENILYSKVNKMCVNFINTDRNFS